MYNSEHWDFMFACACLLGSFVMAEVIAFFGLAANVMQFLEFGSKIVSVNHRAGQQYLALDIIATDLERVTHDLEVSIQAKPSDDASQSDLMLQQLATQCRDVCLELLQVLNKLQVHDGRGKWKSFYKALASVWSERQINGLHKKLDSFRQQLILHLLMALR